MEGVFSLQMTGSRTVERRWRWSEALNPEYWWFKGRSVYVKPKLELMAADGALSRTHLPTFHWSGSEWQPGSTSVSEPQKTVQSPSDLPAETELSEMQTDRNAISQICVCSIPPVGSVRTQRGAFPLPAVRFLPWQENIFGEWKITIKDISALTKF